MTYLYIILAAIAYFAIGGFVSGFIRSSDDAEVFFTLVLWPCFLVFLVIVNVAYLPSKLGEKLRTSIEKRKRRKK